MLPTPPSTPVDIISIEDFLREVSRLLDIHETN